MSKSKKYLPLKITEARENNLKGFSLELAHDLFTVVTGLSGSGKSSLAFSTIYAEGQRRYIETFSPYTRQFFDKVKKPDVTSIENVRPAIAIQQRTRITNSRSTVGSMTNINDFLRILWSNIAAPVCPHCHHPLKAWSASSLASHLLTEEFQQGLTSFLICAPITIPEEFLDVEIERFQMLGYSRHYDSDANQIGLLEDTNALLDREGDFVLALDRVRPARAQPQALEDSLEQAFSLASGRVRVVRIYDDETHEPIDFQSRFACSQPECEKRKIDIPHARPSLFSFNHPIGACPECNGFGRVLEIDPDLCVPNPTLTLEEGAVHCWSVRSSNKEHKRLIRFCTSQGIPIDKPWSKLTKKHRTEIFEHRSREFKGVFAWFQNMERKAYKMHVRVFMSRYRSQFPCPECDGKRLKPIALAFQVNGMTLPELWNLPVNRLHEWLLAEKKTLESGAHFPRELADVFGATLTRLQYLCDLGLSYLSLERQARTLSGGETQRVNLAAALGSELVSIHFVLDEPSVGLHARDTERLITAMRGLQARGNSLMVVEHDLDCIEAADHVVELGPKAGEAGGEIVQSAANDKWDRTRISDPLPPIAKVVKKREKTDPALTVTNATARNLQGINLSIPIGAFTCLSGVSGSGKSTLVTEVIRRAYDEYEKGIVRKEEENKVQGFEHFDQVLLVDQSPLARSPRANIATYSGIWDSIRTLLSDTEEAAARALSKSSFSFNVDAGRCPECKGAGHVREDMQFLSDVYMPCEACLGRRFQGVVLEVTYRGKSVDDFLSMTVDTASQFFHSVTPVCRAAETLSRLGLGHLTLGHSLSELSGGEAQRLKLVPFLQKTHKGTALLIFDEPTTGLHLLDVKNLVSLFHDLREVGHTILCVEHNPTMILAADWIIDLGPEGGLEGGSVVLEGTPKKFLTSKSQSSHTAHFLRSFVEAHTNRSKRKRRSLPAPPKKVESIEIRGAAEHNLKDIDIDIPLDKVIALTGVSGSGKSTIAKDIVYAEGQRRYLDCLSPYARQFIKELKRPDIEHIYHVKPTICVYQHTFQPSRLSTIATMSEAYNYLRLLFAKVGTQFCPEHPESRIAPMTPKEIAHDIQSLEGKSVRVLAPIIKLKKGYHKAVFQRALQSEIGEVRVDGVLDSPAAFEEGLARSKPHSIEYTIARFNPKRVDQELIEDAVHQALGLGSGTVIVNVGEDDYIYSSERTCPECRAGFFKPDPEDLSFNSRRGACPECSGSGFDSRDEECSECEGSRIQPIGRNLRIGDLNIYETCLYTAPELIEFLQEITDGELGETQLIVAKPILRELLSRLETLSSVGLDYLPLDRDCATLSSGELQRLRLATAMGSPLTGAMYIFDEPSAGLHPIDNARVLSQIGDLRDRGNSVIMIEHDSESILASDYVIDVGPGGGRNGGEIVFQGSRDDFLTDSNSTTAVCLRTPPQIESATVKRVKPVEVLSVVQGNMNNIEGLKLQIPLGELVTVAGVSGAGKSSLVHGVIADTLTLGKEKQLRWELDGNVLESTTKIDRVLFVDQKPIGQTSRSTPASYLGLWDPIRKLFANTLEAKSRGWTASFFSFNTGNGRCAECKGQGLTRLEMSFLADAVVVCEACQGTRFSEQARSVRYLDLSISEVLQLTFEEARLKFANHRKVHQILHRACELGLGYLTLGQGSRTLSGGESQRIKLVSELGLKRRGHTLYILDEPTTGLHRSDVERLGQVLRDLVAGENSVIVIEHDPDLLLLSDQVIELGPGPGELGGKVIFQGPPGRLAKAKTPWGDSLRAQLCRPSETPLHPQNAACNL